MYNDAKFLGEVDIDIKDTPCANYTANDWIMTYLFYFSQINGEEQKQWLLDQIARITKGTKVIVKLGKWSNGKEALLFETGSPSKEYLDWVENYKDDGKYTYSEGVKPMDFMPMKMEMV